VQASRSGGSRLWGAAALVSGAISLGLTFIYLLFGDHTGFQITGLLTLRY
jgi:hypothetical protein